MSIIISGFACAHNKCHFCAYGSMPKSTIDHEKFWQEVDQEIALVKSGKQQYAKLFNGGSFLNDEVPHSFKIELLEKLRSANVKHFRFENRFDQVDWKFLKQIIGMGITPHISWGFESSDEKVREYCGKGPPSNEKILETLKKVTDLGGHNILYVMAGLPMPEGHEILPDFKGTISWCHENQKLMSEVISLAYTPAKGSRFFETHWKTGLHRVISKEEFNQCKNFVNDKFFFSHIRTGFFFLQYWVYTQGKTWPEIEAATAARKLKKQQK